MPNTPTPPPNPNTDSYPLAPLPPSAAPTHPAAPDLSSADRLSITPAYRVLTTAALAGTLGAALGASHGGTTTALRFRAENSHRLPTDTRGWYFYHRSKNYHVALGGIREARRMGVRLGVWTAFFVAVEDMFDKVRGARERRRVREARGEEDGGGDEAWGEVRVGVGDGERIAYGQDFLSSVGAGLVTSGYFSLWNQVGRLAAVRIIKMGVLAGFAYGGLQDLMKILQGRKIGIVEKVKGAFLGGRVDVEDEVG